MQLEEDKCVLEREAGSGLRFQMQPVVTSVVSTHHTAVITSLTVYPLVSIALHKLNSVEARPRYCMCLSYHITIYLFPLPFIKAHMVVRQVQLLIINGNAANFPGRVLLNLGFLFP